MQTMIYLFPPVQWKSVKTKWSKQYIVYLTIGVGDGGQKGQLPTPQKKFGKKYFSGKNHVKFGHFVNFFFRHIPYKIREFGNFVNFSGKYHVKFGHFVNFFMHVFSGKNVLPPKADWAPTLMHAIVQRINYVFTAADADAVVATTTTTTFVFCLTGVFIQSYSMSGQFRKRKPFRIVVLQQVFSFK